MPFLATGGTITYSGGKTIHTFTSNGSFSVNGSGNIEILVVGGGGGSGSYNGGGGGAGGVKYSASTAVSSFSYPVTVGIAGIDYHNGGDSHFHNIIWGHGGGSGGRAAVDDISDGSDGGCGGSGGGGGGCNIDFSGGGAGYYGYNGEQGHNGAAGNSNWVGGGGGGAGSAGSAGGIGGSGAVYSISGSPVTYSKGGGYTTTGGERGNGGFADSWIPAVDGIVIISYSSGGLAKESYNNDGEDPEANSKSIVLVPTEFDILQNYPNPFNPTTSIRYQLPALSSVKLAVYDILGREVKTLVDGMKNAGYCTAIFDGSKCSSGIYLVRLSAIPQNGSQPFVKVMKMLMVK